MAEPSKVVIERIKVREVAGIIHSGAAVEAAVDALLSAGFDRADIDLLANDDTVRQRLGGVYVPVEELPDVPEAPRHAAIKRDDLIGLSALAFALIAAIGGMAGVIIVAASDGGWQEELAAGLAGAFVVGVVVALTVRWVTRRRKMVLDPDAGETVLWVRVRSPAQEERPSAFCSRGAPMRSGFMRSTSTSALRTCRSAPSSRGSRRSERSQALDRGYRPRELTWTSQRCRFTRMTITHRNCATACSKSCMPRWRRRQVTAC